jgi:hypothetical protein
VPPDKTTKRHGKSKVKRGSAARARATQPAANVETRPKIPPAKLAFIEATAAVGSVDSSGTYTPPTIAPRLEHYVKEAYGTLASVGRLIRRAEDLRISRYGSDGSGPHETKLSRTVAEGLFVAYRALQTTIAVAQYGSALPGWQDQVSRAWHLFRGGGRNKSPSADRLAALGVAHQALAYALGIGFRGRTQDDAVRLVRERYTFLFGSVFRDVPDDATIRAHLTLDSSSQAGEAAVRWARGETQRDEFDHEVELAAITLVADVLWAAHVAAGDDPSESVFRFPMGDRKSQPDFHKLLANCVIDSRRKRRGQSPTGARRGRPPKKPK